MLNNPSHKVQDSQMPTVPYIVAGVVTKVYDSLGTVSVLNSNTGDTYNDVRVCNNVGSSDEEGFVAMPQLGDVVVIAFINNSSFHPVILGRLFSRGNKMPLATTGEHVYKHRSGTVIKIALDGTVTINSKKVVLHGDTTVGHTHGPGTYATSMGPVISGVSGSATDTINGSGE